MSEPFDFTRVEPAPATIPTGREKQPPRHKPGEKFLKGPIPWPWIESAGALPGKALAIGLAVWRKAGCRNVGMKGRFRSTCQTNASRAGRLNGHCRHWNRPDWFRSSIGTGGPRL